MTMTTRSEHRYVVAILFRRMRMTTMMRMHLRRSRNRIGSDRYPTAPALAMPGGRS
jgi:hypothetical protein